MHPMMTDPRLAHLTLTVDAAPDPDSLPPLRCRHGSAHVPGRDPFSDSWYTAARVHWFGRGEPNSAMVRWLFLSPVTVRHGCHSTVLCGCEVLPVTQATT